MECVGGEMVECVFYSVEEVKTLMIQLLRAVCHLHHNNIIHRDLNTSNLLLSKKGVLKVHGISMSTHSHSQ